MSYHDKIENFYGETEGVVRVVADLKSHVVVISSVEGEGDRVVAERSPAAQVHAEALVFRKVAHLAVDLCKRNQFN